MTLKTGDIVIGKWEIVKLLGSGSFGKVYLTKHIETRAMAAVKWGGSEISYERDMYKALHNTKTMDGIPRVLDFGREGGKYCLVLSRLGKTLEKRLREAGGKFSERITLKIGSQLLKRLHSIHRHGILHRDLKPANVMCGYSDHSKDKCYLVDFNLGKKFKTGRNEHIAKEFIGFRGTVRYASRNAHDGKTLSRRDDLESLAYMLIYFLKGRLPWQEIPRNDPKRDEKMGQMKKEMCTAKLCEGLSPVFHKFVNKVRRLRFPEKPNYSELIKDLEKGRADLRRH